MNIEDRRRMQGARLAAARVAAGFRSARDAALSNAWTESSYRSHENGTRTIGPDDAERYAKAFQSNGAKVSAGAILFGGQISGPPYEGERSFDPDLPDAAPEPKTSGTAIEVDRPRLVIATYGGKVEAGSFREVDELDYETAKPPRPEPRDPDFPDVPLIYFDIVGDSMNALKPHPLYEGHQVVGVDFEGLKNRVTIRDGMVVVVEQTASGGHLRERSVKQIENYPDRTEFCPRSTNPRHKPIVVPYEMDADDGKEVKILAIVRRVTADIPGW